VIKIIIKTHLTVAKNPIQIGFKEFQVVVSKII